MRDVSLSPEDVALLASLLRRNSNVEVIDMGNTALCGLDPFGRGTYQTRSITAFSQAIGHPRGPARSLKSLFLGANFIDHRAASILSDGLSNCQALTSLHLSFNQVGHTGIAELVQGEVTGEGMRGA